MMPPVRKGGRFFLFFRKKKKGAEQKREGELAQLARASALHAEGQRFESVILHSPNGCSTRAGERRSGRKKKKEGLKGR